jgi:hypothetical protein
MIRATLEVMITRLNEFLSPKRTRGRIWAARALAIFADLLEIVLFPVFALGGASPPNDVVDVFMMIALTWLLGWHPAFLSTFIAEMLPFLSLVPTWTAAVLFVTRDGAEERRSKTIHARVT